MNIWRERMVSGSICDHMEFYLIQSADEGELNRVDEGWVRRMNKVEQRTVSSVIWLFRQVGEGIFLEMIEGQRGRGRDRERWRERERERGGGGGGERERDRERWRRERRLCNIMDWQTAGQTNMTQQFVSPLPRCDLQISNSFQYDPFHKAFFQWQMTKVSDKSADNQSEARIYFTSL